MLEVLGGQQINTNMINKKKSVHEFTEETKIATEKIDTNRLLRNHKNAFGKDQNLIRPFRDTNDEVIVSEAGQKAKAFA